MYTRCLVCSTPFPANGSLEHLPSGERVAFDPERGRLWVVCPACRRWSLAPLEERWEALEELERIVTDEATLLSRTDNIALLRARDVEIVRVGRARLDEQAWWRYGRELRSRRESYKKISLAGTVAAGTVAVGGWATGGMSFLAMWLIMDHAPDRLADAARWLRFGSAAWRGQRTCDACGHVFRSIRYRDRGGMGLLPGVEPGAVELVRRCPRCGVYRDGGLHLTGEEAEVTLRRVLAYHHFEGASERRVKAATRLIQEVGSPREVTRLVLREGKRLGELQRNGAIALEIAANESAEEHLLELELAELEARWRREEELASIVDGELTPLPLLESLRRKVTGRR